MRPRELGKGLLCPQVRSSGKTRPGEGVSEAETPPSSAPATEPACSRAVSEEARGLPFHRVCARRRARDGTSRLHSSVPGLALKARGCAATKGGRRSGMKRQVLHLRSSATTRRDVASTLVSPRSCAQGERIRRHKGGGAGPGASVRFCICARWRARDGTSRLRSSVRGLALKARGCAATGGRSAGPGWSVWFVGDHATGRRVYIRQSQVLRSGREDAPPPWGAAGTGASVRFCICARRQPRDGTSRLHSSVSGLALKTR
jgi:hypothetical protein